MTHLKPILLSLVFTLATSFAYAESSYDISELYSIVKAPSGTKAIGTYDKTIEVKYILTPTKVDTGKYVVEVKKIGDNLYQIKDTEICVETLIVMNGHPSQKK